MKNNPSIISFLGRNTSALALSVFLLVTTLGFGQECVSLKPILITAASDLAICNTTTATISVNSEVPGVWTKLSGTGVIVNPGAKTTEVINLSFSSSNVFKWTPTLGACQSLDPKSDTSINVVAKKSPQITALTTTPLSCSTSQVSATIIGGDTTDVYTWTTTDGNIVSGANTKVIEVSKTGTYTLTITPMTLGITTAACPSTMSVVVPFVGTNVKVVIAQPVNLSCINPTVILDGRTSTSGANIKYQWTAANGGIIGAVTTNNTVVAYSAGTYILNIFDVTTACSSTAYVNVGIDSPPQARIAPFEKLTCLSNSITLDGSASTSGNNIIYEWNTTGGEIVSGATTNKAIVSGAGMYTLTVTDVITNCASTTNVSVTSECNLSSPEFEFDSQFNLYPNPTADVLNIQPKSDTVINSIAVYNFMGQLVLNTTETTATINVSGLPKGAYILKVISNNGTTATKFVKE